MTLAAMNMTLAELAADKEMLTNVLLHHVLPVVVRSEDAPAEPVAVPTLL